MSSPDPHRSRGAPRQCNAAEAAEAGRRGAHEEWPWERGRSDRRDGGDVAAGSGAARRQSLSVCSESSLTWS